MATSINNLQKKDKIYYLASPFTHKCKKIERCRYEEAIHTAVRLIKKGFCLLEPIAMSYAHSKKYGLSGGYEFWQSRDRLFISRCDGVLVLNMDGWDLSVGVTDEIQYAKSLGLPVYLISSNNLKIVRRL